MPDDVALIGLYLQPTVYPVRVDKHSLRAIESIVRLMVKTHRFNGVKYDIDIGECDGSCDSPNGGRPTLFVNHKMDNSKRFMYLVIHEAMHACNWSKSEAEIEKASTDLHKFLWRLGFRLGEK